MLRRVSLPLVLLAGSVLPNEAFALEGCDRIRMALRSGFDIDGTINGVPRTQDEKAGLWDETVARYRAAGVICLERNPYRGGRPSANRPKTVKPKPVTGGKVNRDNGLTDTAKVDPDPDWANDTRKRILDGKSEKVVDVKPPNTVPAPYGPSDCAEIKPAPNRGQIDWDWVKIRNKCSYPIKVLTCYYDKGQQSKCGPGGKGWGLSGTLAPGEVTTSVATSERMPWYVSVMVCDLRDKTRTLCVLPPNYR